MAFLEEIIQNSPWLTRDRFSEPDEAERELWRTGKLVPAYISKLLDSAHLCRPDVPSMSNGDMVYRSAPLGDELHQTTLAVAWTAADIYALEPASGDAIAEAAADLSRTTSANLAVLVAVINDAAYLAYQRRIPAGHQPGRYELSTPGAR